MSRLRIGVGKLASCSGCINELIYALLSDPLLSERLEIVYFPELQDNNSLEGRFDVFFLEGSVVNREQREKVEDIRERSKLVVAVGTCSTYGGIQSLRDRTDIEEVKRFVYPRPELIDVEEDVYSVQEVIKTDLAIPGCPINGDSFLRVARKLVLGGGEISIPESLCAECKRKGIDCVFVRGRSFCMGPIISAGCGAICPSFGRGCIGCFGLRSDLAPRDIEKFAERVEKMGLARREDVYSFAMRFSYAKDKDHFERIMKGGRQ
ncbi:MAG: Ni/Fe hydrogenase subunit delta [Fervidicoccaceae archaeon]|jgi:coenzyme F420-reducing hydrogenase gamma subunit